MHGIVQMAVCIMTLHNAFVLTSFMISFHASRYPVKPSDTARKFDPKTHNHVVFIRKNKFFKVPLATPAGEELSAAELEV
jgi:carnitine O-acetyltransferase